MTDIESFKESVSAKNPGSIRDFLATEELVEDREALALYEGAAIRFKQAQQTEPQPPVDQTVRYFKGIVL